MLHRLFNKIDKLNASVSILIFIITIILEGKSMLRKILYLFFVVFLFSILSCAKKTDVTGKTSGKDGRENASLEGNETSGGQDTDAIAENEEAIISQLDFTRIHFEYDQFTLTSTAKAVLDHHAELLKKYPKIVLKIVGHCDERGSNEYNLALGSKRAQEIKNYLVTLGVTENRLITESLGEEQPVKLEKTEESFAFNRRGEFSAQK